jgi:hypothetical protein
VNATLYPRELRCVAQETGFLFLWDSTSLHIAYIGRSSISYSS